MAGVGPRWVLCNGATHRDAPEEALRIGLGDGDWYRVSVGIEGLEDRMTGALPSAMRDLMHLAAFVLAADCSASRGTLTAVDNGETWRRDFRFVVPVADPDRWNRPELREALETTLGFLSDDVFHFEFVPGREQDLKGRINFLPSGDARTFSSWTQVDRVQLFSGGMDSFAGAADACFGEKIQPLLVSHHSSSKVKGTQRRLISALRDRVGGNSPWYLGVDVQRHHRQLRNEESQRTRSFLFAAIAGAVAWLAGQRRVRFHENGIIGLNLPISAQLSGSARGTRTVHPRVLDGFERILTLVGGERVVVDNPYQWMTRVDVAERIRDLGMRELLRHTRSCAGVRGATRMHPFCGVCSQCVDRQFAVRAAGMLADDPEEMYEVRLFDSPLEADRDVQLAVGYVSTARVFAALAGRQELQGHFGEVLDASPDLARQWSITPEEALDRVVELHRRQGRMVSSVVAAELAQRLAPLIGGNLHPGSLLARCVERGLNASRQTYGMEDPDASAAGGSAMPMDQVAAADRAQHVGRDEIVSLDPVTELLPGRLLSNNLFMSVGQGWLVGLVGTRGVVVQDSKGMRLLRTLLQHPHRPYAVLELEAATHGVDPDLADTGRRRGGRHEEDTPDSTSPGSFVKVDGAALRDFRARIAKLREDEAEANEFGDHKAALEARTQRESLEDRLRRDVGLGGRVAEVAPEVERARSRVSKAIERAFKDICSAGHLPLKRYLANTVETGFDMEYRPDAQCEWVTTV